MGHVQQCRGQQVAPHRRGHDSGFGIDQRRRKLCSLRPARDSHGRERFLRVRDVIQSGSCKATYLEGQIPLATAQSMGVGSQTAAIQRHPPYDCLRTEAARGADASGGGTHGSSASATPPAAASGWSPAQQRRVRPQSPQPQAPRTGPPIRRCIHRSALHYHHLVGAEYDVERPGQRRFLCIVVRRALPVQV